MGWRLALARAAARLSPTRWLPLLPSSHQVLARLPGILLDSRDKCGRTPLHWAAAGCQEKAVTTLLSFGVRPRPAYPTPPPLGGRAAAPSSPAGFASLRRTRVWRTARALRPWDMPTSGTRCPRSFGCVLRRAGDWWGRGDVVGQQPCISGTNRCNEPFFGQVTEPHLLLLLSLLRSLFRSCSVPAHFPFPLPLPPHTRPPGAGSGRTAAPKWHLHAARGPQRLESPRQPYGRSPALSGTNCAYDRPGLSQKPPGWQRQRRRGRYGRCRARR